MKNRFFITSLVAAGFLPHTSANAVPHTGVWDVKPKQPPTLFKTFRLDHKYTLAAHRSHSSHGSHRSHRSSTGGGYSAPSRNNNSTPPGSTLPSPPATAPQYAPKELSPLPGNTEKFKKIVMQLQVALAAFGFYSGAVDGVMDTETRVAITKMQKDWGMKVTGTITPEVLNSFGIVAN